jgi:hypothetical protein
MNNESWRAIYEIGGRMFRPVLTTRAGTILSEVSEAETCV